MERESEGQIAIALSSSRSLYRSLLSVMLSLSPPTFHSHSGTLTITLPSHLPFSLHQSISSFYILSFLSVLRCHLHTRRSLFQFHSLGWYIGWSHIHRHAHRLTHSPPPTHHHTHPPGPQVITSQTRPRKYRISLGFEFAQTHKHFPDCSTLATRASLNLICVSAADGSEESFQPINNTSPTCMKLNRWLLVIMNVLTDLSGRSGAQMIGNSSVVESILIVFRASYYYHFHGSFLSSHLCEMSFMRDEFQLM